MFTLYVGRGELIQNRQEATDKRFIFFAGGTVLSREAFWEDRNALGYIRSRGNRWIQFATGDGGLRVDGSNTIPRGREFMGSRGVEADFEGPMDA